MKTLSLTPAAQSLLASLVAGALPAASEDQRVELEAIQRQLSSESLVPVVLVRRNDSDEMAYAASAPVRIIYLEDNESADFDPELPGCVEFFGEDCWITQVQPPVEDFTDYLAEVGTKSLV